MKSFENQVWSKHLKVSEKDFQKWQAEKSENSFIFWSLEKKLIPSKDYFDWATEYYDIPQLQDIFFEHHFIKKKEWQEVRRLHTWTKEKVPVAIWNKVVFIGCLEPSLPEKDFDFEYRFVLVSKPSLQKIWNFTKSLSQAILKAEEKTLSKLAVTAQASATAKPLIKKKVQNKITSKSVGQASFPDPEEERVQETENKTFPGRTYEREDNLIMGDFKNKRANKKTKPLLSSEWKEEKTNNSTLYVIKQEEKFQKLWDKTTNLFCTVMILEVKDKKAYPLSYQGKISIKESNQSLVNLEDYSLFKVVQRGHPYHGFVVDTQANKDFFNKIGWPNFPTHVSAIPIKNASQELQYIFMGLSIKVFSRSSIQDVEKIISDFFNSNNKTKLKLAS